MGGFVFDTSREDEIASTTEKPAESSTANTRDERNVPTLTAFIYIMQHFPHIIPDISEESITDRAESSNIRKALLIFQVGWFCISCISRIAQRLPLSLFEVSTAAHGFYTLLTIFVWLSKPLNIAEGTAMRGEEAREVYALLQCSGTEYMEARRMASAEDFSTSTHRGKQWRVVLAASALRHNLSDSEEPPIFPFQNPSRLSIPGSYMASGPNIRPGWRFIAIAISPVVYGLIHLLGWSINFPTPWEGRLWRICSIAVLCSGFAFTFWVQTVMKLPHPMKARDSVIGVRVLIVFMLAFLWAILIVLILLAYILASGFLLVESFRQLFFLNPAAYQLASWSVYWPHF